MSASLLLATASLDTSDLKSGNGAGEILNKIAQNRTKSIDETDAPNERAIDELISRGDFNKARKLIDKLPEGSQRLELNELVNAKEAIYLLKEDKFVESQRLAERLNERRQFGKSIRINRKVRRL